MRVLHILSATAYELTDPAQLMKSPVTVPQERRMNE